MFKKINGSKHKVWSRLSKAEEKILWKEYRETRSEEVRNKLVLGFMYLVDDMCSFLIKRFPKSISLDELTSAGYAILIRTVEKFDPDLGVSFKTFSEQRIRGAILDYIRELDWVPRLVRSRQAKRDRTMNSFESGGYNGGDKNAEEILLTKLGEDFEKVIKDTRFIPVCTSLSEVLNRGCKDLDTKEMSRLSFLEKKEREGIGDSFNTEEIRNAIVDGTLLPQASYECRVILVQYYFEEMKLKVIGSLLSLSESRCSQLLSEALLMLRGQKEKIVEMFGKSV